MNPYMAYEAVNTKITTKKGNILDDKKLEKISECDSVEEVTEYLRNKYHLQQVIDDARSHDLHRDDLETLLKRYRVSEIEDLLHYFSGPYKEFLQVLLMEQEISDLIMILRKTAKEDDPEHIEKNFVHSEHYSVLPYSKLKTSRNVPQLIENLKGTPYYNVLKTMTSSDVQKREFHAEMKLQGLLYKTLMQKSEKLDAADKRAVQEILGLKIDLLNAQWIYRAKKYYNISPEQVLIYSLQGGRKLGFNRLKELCYTKTVEEMKKLSQQYLRFNIFSTGNDIDIEINIEKYIYEFANERKYRGTIGVVLTYIYKLDIEIKNFITVTEGIRYKLPREELKRYLVHS